MRNAQQVEAAGWDGMVLVDSQNLSGDVYVAMAMAATVTERIGLGTGVTNSITRQGANRVPLSNARCCRPYMPRR